MNDSIEPLKALHTKFCELAGLDGNDLRFHKQWSRVFYDFHREGFTADEMALVIRYVQAQNKKVTSPYYRRKIVPSKIIGDMERFCEDLAEAKRLQALRVMPRQQAVNEFRHFQAPEDVKMTAQTVREALRKALQ